MTEPTRIRAQALGEKTTVRVLMNHEMESGQRKDASGKIIPSWYIQEMTVMLNAKVVLTAEFGTSVSKNPYLQFILKGGKAGDKITLSWRDNKGEMRSDEASIT
jgi:sulfur-oxidizing protein SoxZ